MPAAHLKMVHRGILHIKSVKQLLVPVLIRSLRHLLRFTVCPKLTKRSPRFHGIVRSTECMLEHQTGRLNECKPALTSFSHLMGCPLSVTVSDLTTASDSGSSQCTCAELSVASRCAPSYASPHPSFRPLDAIPACTQSAGVAQPRS